MSTRLLQPFARFGGVFLFLFLEVVSFYLVVSFNKKHNQIYLSTANSVTGTAYDRYDAVTDYFSLKQQIQDLQAENAMLRNRLGIARYENIPRVDTVALGDSLKQKFLAVPAKVISNFYANSNNMLTINRGKNHGVAPDQGVIDARGIVGITRQVSNNYATVMSLFHDQTRISARIKRTDSFGSLEWDGRTLGYMQLKAIPQHDSVSVGDTVMTSGYAHHFPPDIVIGVVEESELEQGSNFYTVKVKLINDLRKVRHVYVLRNEMLDEIRSIEQPKQQ